MDGAAREYFDAREYNPDVVKIYIAMECAPSVSHIRSHVSRIDGVAIHTHTHQTTPDDRIIPAIVDSGGAGKTRLMHHGVLAGEYNHDVVNIEITMKDAPRAPSISHLTFRTIALNL